jgi:beta propeller domain-containing protein
VARGTRTRWGITGTVAAAGVGAAVLALVPGGPLNPALHRAGKVVGSAVAPPASAAELPAFSTCEQLRQWYVHAALPEVGPWGLGPPPMMLADPGSGRMQPLGTTAAEDRVPAAQAPVGSSPSGTNVQQAGVDEGDIAKTDGRVVVRVVGQELVVTDVSGPRAVEVSRTRLPGTLLFQPELLLHDGVVTVVGTEGRMYDGRPPIRYRELRSPGFLPPSDPGSRTRIVSLDVSGSTPRLLSDRTVDGEPVAVREYAGGTVRVVVGSHVPRIRFVQPDRQLAPAEATAQNRKLVRQAPLAAWLPRITSGSGHTSQLLGCSEVRHPARASGFGTLSVLTFAPGAAGRPSATAVTTAGDLVYSSADRLYVATTSVDGRERTTVHAFALDGPRTSYLASGTLPGTVKDRWSLDEYDGHLRAAVALGSPWQPRDNALVVLDERGDRLVPVGRLDGLGRGEQIQAVRWLGDVAVVVTYRQTDPLYTVDLGDAEHPRLVGALHLRGFSGYLHPLGDDLLLGLGRDATSTGADLGARAATFDLRDLAHVRRTGVLDLRRATDLATLDDPHAFAYLPAQRTAVLPVTGEYAARFVALHVGTDGTLRRAGSWSAAGSDAVDDRVLPLGGDRVALVGQAVRIVHVG